MKEIKAKVWDLAATSRSHSETAIQCLGLGSVPRIDSVLPTGTRA